VATVKAYILDEVYMSAKAQDIERGLLPREARKYWILDSKAGTREFLHLLVRLRNGSLLPANIDLLQGSKDQKYQVGGFRSGNSRIYRHKTGNDRCPEKQG